MRIDMDRYEQIRPMTIGELGTFFQLKKHITISSHQHAHVRSFVEKFLEPECDFQCDVFFCSPPKTDRAWVLSPWPGSITIVVWLFARG